MPISKILVWTDLLLSNLLFITLPKFQISLEGQFYRQNSFDQISPLKTYFVEGFLKPNSLGNLIPPIQLSVIQTLVGKLVRRTFIISPNGDLI